MVSSSAGLYFQYLPKKEVNYTIDRQDKRKPVFRVTYTNGYSFICSGHDALSEIFNMHKGTLINYLYGRRPWPKQKRSSLCDVSVEILYRKQSPTPKSINKSEVLS